ncbi:Hypothetical protein BHO_0024300 (plasmid) [Borrelia hermsii YBT]|nr:Hypothetical protein BHO_0024300 [Borrelia hermsii YBT]
MVCVKKEKYMNAINPAFDELGKVLMGFKEELANKHTAFVPEETQLNINFKGALNEIYYPSDLEGIYEALGYDVEVIRSLGQIFEKLDFSSIHDRDTRTVANLLNSFIHIVHSIHTLFEEVLNSAKLEMLKSRDAGDLKKITQYLVQFIDGIKDLISRVKDGMISAASRTTAEDVVKALNGGILANHNVMLNSMLRNLHGLVFDIMELIDLDMIIA